MNAKKKIDPDDNVFRYAARKLGLSRDEFHRRMEALVRKFQLYERIKQGDARLRKVWVEPYKVSAYKVSGHYRYIEDRRQTAPPATRRIRRTHLKVMQGGKR